MQDVSDEAQVNRALIYQYFGSRRDLLRAALKETQWEYAPSFQKDRLLPFGQRRIRVFKTTLRRRAILNLKALLMLDGDLDPGFVGLDIAQSDLSRDIETGELDEDADPDVMHGMTLAACYGYAIIRNTFAKELGITGKQLDKRATTVFARMVEGLRASETSRN